jgi:hypothetical protein
MPRDRYPVQSEPGRQQRVMSSATLPEATSLPLEFLANQFELGVDTLQKLVLIGRILLEKYGDIQQANYENDCQHGEECKCEKGKVSG